MQKAQGDGFCLALFYSDDLTTAFNPTVFSKAFSLPTKRRRPFGEKHAAFYPKARLLFEKAGVLLKIAARAFFKSRRPFRFALPRGLFHLLVLEGGEHFLQVDARTESHLCTLNHRGVETVLGLCPFARERDLERTEITKTHNLTVFQVALQHLGEVVKNCKHIAVAHRGGAFGDFLAQFAECKFFASLCLCVELLRGGCVARITLLGQYIGYCHGFDFLFS